MGQTFVRTAVPLAGNITDILDSIPCSLKYVTPTIRLINYEISFKIPPIIDRRRGIPPSIFMNLEGKIEWKFV